MDQENIFNYQELNNKINDFFYSQFVDYFKFNINHFPTFKIISKDNFRYLLFRNSNTHTIGCFDLNNSQIISKSDFFFRHIHTLNYLLINQSLKHFTDLNELSFDKEISSGQALTLYNQNFKPNSFPVGYQTFKSLINLPIFNKFITYHRSSAMFSFPLFSDENFNAINYLDFNKDFYKPRNHTPFSIWYPSELNKACAPIDNDFTSGVKENKLVISFNPLSLINYFDPIYSTNENVNYFPILMESPFDFPKFLWYSNLVKPLQFDKIILLYSSHQSFWQNDLINHLKLIIYTINTSNPEYHFEVNLSYNNSLNVFIHSFPELFDVMEIGNLTTRLSDQIYRNFCGKENPKYLNDMVSDNIKTIAKYSFTYRKVKHGKKVSYYITIPLKIEPIEYFFNYLLTFLPAFSIEQFYGSNIFNDGPF